MAFLEPKRVPVKVTPLAKMRVAFSLSESIVPSALEESRETNERRDKKRGMRLSQPGKNRNFVEYFSTLNYTRPDIYAAELFILEGTQSKRTRFYTLNQGSLGMSKDRVYNV